MHLKSRRRLLEQVAGNSNMDYNKKAGPMRGVSLEGGPDACDIDMTDLECYNLGGTTLEVSQENPTTEGGCTGGDRWRQAVGWVSDVQARG